MVSDVARPRACRRPWRRASATASSAAASTRWTTTSASSAPPQAARTMARSSRRRGWKMPGVSTSTICASPSMRHAAHREARRLHLLGDDGDLGADQPVDQRRLARIGRADDGGEAGAGHRFDPLAGASWGPLVSTASSGGGLLRVLARTPLGRLGREALDRRPATVKQRRMVRPVAADDRIGRRGRPRPCAHSCSAVLGSLRRGSCGRSNSSAQKVRKKARAHSSPPRCRGPRSAPRRRRRATGRTSRAPLLGRAGRQTAAPGRRRDRGPRRRRA